LVGGISDQHLAVAHIFHSYSFRSLSDLGDYHCHYHIIIYTPLSERAHPHFTVGILQDQVSFWERGWVAGLILLLYPILRYFPAFGFPLWRYFKWDNNMFSCDFDNTIIIYVVSGGWLELDWSDRVHFAHSFCI
jgi:hypothetical protein